MIEANSEQVDYSPPVGSECVSQSLQKTVSHVFSSCRICLSSVFDPATLTCGHSFCEQCLNLYWKAKNKLDFIICPLCRGRTSNIAFVKKEQTSSTEEFRKMFNLSDKAHLFYSISLCFKISMIPVMYLVIKCLRSVLNDLYNYLPSNTP